MTEYKLIPYADDDYELVYEIKKNAYKKYVEEYWGRWNEEIQQEYFKKFIDGVKNNAYMIIADDKKIGFYNGENLENGDYEIGNICIIPEYQGQGIGTQILKDIMKKHYKQNIVLQYFKQNPVGKLYERLGFVHTGETDKHYQMKMDAKLETYFSNDEYWHEHISKNLEKELWIDDYKKYFIPGTKCLELGCGIGQYSKRMMEYGLDVTSTDISEIALNEVKKFNSNVLKVDMSKKLPFEDSTFDMVFAALSIHYFDDATTKQLMLEIKRVLKGGGVFMGSVNGIVGLKYIKDIAFELDKHFYFTTDKYIRLFDEDDVKNYMSVFDIEKIENRDETRFGNPKNYYIFIVRKN